MGCDIADVVPSARCLQVLEVTASNFFFTPRLRFIARIAILFFLCALFSFPFIYLLSPSLALSSLLLSACTGFHNVNEWIRMCNLCRWKKGEHSHFTPFPIKSVTRFRSCQRNTSIFMHRIHTQLVHRKWGEIDDDPISYANAFRQYYFYFLHFQTHILLWVDGL